MNEIIKKELKKKKLRISFEKSGERKPTDVNVDCVRLYAIQTKEVEEGRFIPTTKGVFSFIQENNQEQIRVVYTDNDKVCWKTLTIGELAKLMIKYGKDWNP